MCDLSYVVCANCMRSEKVLSSWVKDKGTPGICSYCGQKCGSTLPISEIAQFVLEHLRTEYETYIPGTVEIHGIEFPESLYFTTHEILADVLDYQGDVGGIPDSNQLISCLCAELNNLIAPHCAWKKLAKDASGGNILWNWREFVGEVKHRRRFLFWLNEKSKGTQLATSMSTENMLQNIGDSVLQDKIRPIEAGTTIYRARVAMNGDVFSGTKQLGAPPPNAAKAGRMNPPGIPYFYAAFDNRTACAEVCSDSPETLQVVYVGDWKLTKELKFVDLCRIEEIPSFFDPENRQQRNLCLFLRNFIEDICDSITQDDIAQLAYIPAQVVSEYFRTALYLENKKAVDGVIFNSTKNPRGECIVVFPSEDYMDAPFGAFADKLKLVRGEKILVGAEPDMVLPKVTEKRPSESWKLWEVSAQPANTQ